MILQRRSVWKDPECSSTNLNLMAFGPRRTGRHCRSDQWRNMTAFFQDFPLLLENAVLASKPVILLGEAQIFFRHHISIPMSRDPFVQRRHADARIISYLLTRQTAGQRDTHRIIAKFVRSFQSHSQPPLLQQMLSKERHQTATGPNLVQEYETCRHDSPKQTIESRA